MAGAGADDTGHAVTTSGHAYFLGFRNGYT